MNYTKYLTLGILIFSSFYFYAQYNSDNLKIMSIAPQEYQIENDPNNYNISYSFKNLRLFPIIANDNFIDHHKDIGRFTLLKDAIEQNKILITETGVAQESEIEINNQIQQSINQNIQNISGSISGTVNTLIAKNNSIIHLNVEEKSQFLVSSAEYILNQI